MQMRTFPLSLDLWSPEIKLAVHFGAMDSRSWLIGVVRRVDNVTGSLSGPEFHTNTIKTEQYTYLRGPLSCQMIASE